MTHYDISEWADFVRGLGSAAQRAALEDHLASGCSRCRRAHDALRGVASVAALDVQQDPPEYALRSARAIFALGRARPGPGWSRRLAALVFDSATTPALAGVRRDRPDGRHLLHRAGDFYVDLRLESAGSKGSIIVGQIADQTRIGAPLNRVPVFATAGTRIVARTTSNELGEFQLVCASKTGFRLHLIVERGGKPVEIVIPAPSSPRPRPSARRRRREGSS